MSNAIRIDAKTDPARARAALMGPLVFGRVLADLMVQCVHDAEHGWHDAAIVPFAPLSISPAAKVLHYGQEIFEGHKAYRWQGGEVALFRPEENARRLNVSARRLLLPEVPVRLQLEATEALVDALRDWVPDGLGTSLYIRPTLIGIEPALGVAPSREHLYFIIAAPVGPYFEKGFGCVRVRVEEHETRAAPGGVGSAKAGGNYAAGMAAQMRAKAAGFDQALFLDGVEHTYVEECNAMNVFYVRDGVLCTPPLGDTVLRGIVRQSVLELAPSLGLATAERSIAINELCEGIRAGRVTEMMAVGTGAIITPIGVLGFKDETLTIGDGAPGPIVRKLYDALLAIQYGRDPDTRSWMRVVPRR